MIRNSVILGLLALAGLAVATPALTGFYLAREFDSAIADFERSGIGDIVSSRFKRGWLNSQATIRVRMDNAHCARTPCPVVTLETTLHHGPIAFTAPADPDTGLQSGVGVAVTRIDPAVLWPRLLFRPALEPLLVVTRIGFDGRTQSRLRAEGASFGISRERALARVEMSTLSARAELAPDGAVAGTLDWPRFKMVGEAGGQFAWRGLTAATSGADAGNNGVAGPRLRMESLRLANRQGLSALLQNLEWRLQPLPSAAGHAGARFEIRSDRVVLDNREYGPLIVQGRAEHLDVAAWAQLRAQLAALGDDSDGPDEAIRARLYRDTLPRLLAAAPVLDIQRLQLVTPAGDVRARLHLAAPETPRPARLLADVISQLAVDFEGEMPAALVRDIATETMLAKGRAPSDIGASDVDRVLADWVARGLIERALGDAYRIRLVIEDGRLTLNGRNQIGWQAVVDQFEAARERL